MFICLSIYLFIFHFLLFLRFYISRSLFKIYHCQRKEVGLKNIDLISPESSNSRAFKDIITDDRTMNWVSCVDEIQLNLRGYLLSTGYRGGGGENRLLLDNPGPAGF